MNAETSTVCPPEMSVLEPFAWIFSMSGPVLSDCGSMSHKRKKIPHASSGFNSSSFCYPDFPQKRGWSVENRLRYFPEAGRLIRSRGGLYTGFAVYLETTTNS